MFFYHQWHTISSSNINMNLTYLVRALLCTPATLELTMKIKLVLTFQ